MRCEEMLAQFHAMLIIEMVAGDCAILLQVRSQFPLSVGNWRVCNESWIQCDVYTNANSSFQANSCNFDRTHWCAGLSVCASFFPLS